MFPYRRGWAVLIVFLFMLSALVPSVVRGQTEATPIKRGPSTEPDPVQFKWSMLDDVPQEFLTNHEGCYLLMRDVHQLEPDGAVTSTHHFIARANTRNGWRTLGDWLLWFDPSCEEMTLNAARVHKADGNVIDVADEDLHVRDENTDYFEFDLSKYLVVSFAQVKAGDVVEVKYTRRRSDPQFMGQLFDTFNFYDEAFPVHRAEVLVRLPQERTLLHETYGIDVKPTETVDGAHRTYQWITKNQQPLLTEDEMPADNEFKPGATFSTFASWEEVGRTVSELRKPRMVCTQEIAQHVESVTRDCPTPLEKTWALAAWVRDNIRYLSIRHGAFGHRPHKPAEVFAKRYGNCNDVTQLLHVMLREAGVTSSFVFLNNSEDIQLSPTVPSPMANHVILMVELDGQRHWIDPTGFWTRWNQLRGDLYGRQAYVLDGESVRLIKTPERTAAVHRVDQEVTVDLDANGSARWHVERTYHGDAAEQWRSYYQDLSPRARRRDLFKDYLGYFTSARLHDRDNGSFPLGEADDPWRVSFDFTVPNQIEEDETGRYVYVHFPALYTHVGITMDKNRKRPFVFKPCELNNRVRLRLPAVYTSISLTESQTVESRFGTATLTTDWLDEGLRELEFVWQVRLTSPRIEVDELTEFQEFLDRAGELTSAGTGIDYPVGLDGETLLGLLAIEKRRPLDATTVVALAEVYAANGDLERGRGAIETGLEAGLEDVRLWMLKAKYSASAAQRITVYREIVKRWPGEAIYQIELAKLLSGNNEHEEAEKLLRTVAASRNLSPEQRARAHLELARQCLERDNEKDASDALDSALAVYPDAELWDDLLVLHGRCQLERQFTFAALTQFNSVLEFNPSHAEALAGASRSYYALENRQAARVMLRRLMAAVESDITGLMLAAETGLEIDDANSALEMTREALGMLGRDLGAPAAHFARLKKLIGRLASTSQSDAAKELRISLDVLERRRSGEDETSPR